ncbi:ATP-binding protein [Niastella caeni]|nr:ATP-binding protein [Niastella caeni]
MKKSTTIQHQTALEQQNAVQRLDVKKRADKLMNYFLIGFFAGGIGLAFFFDTWLIAFGIGGTLLAAYYTTKITLPNSNLYQYVLSVVLALFMAQFIYQMHGMFEMHFFAFIGSAILIAYQNWKLQVPILVVVVLHHAILGYLQDIGHTQVYFTRLDYFDVITFTIHIILAGIIFFICGLWAYLLKKYNVHLRKINAELDKARIEAETACNAKSIFLATMSHEIRTPMNGVINMSSMLAETPLTEKQREYTNIISTCGESLLNVINDILDFSKIESGKMDLEKEDFLLRNCIEDVLHIFSAKSAETGLDLSYRIEGTVPDQILGDELRLRQILTNLIGNAIKFTNEGEVFVGVRTISKANDQYELQFEIRDTGIGIPADKMQRLFKAFSQVDSSTNRKYGGTGLGLAIAQKLVELMGGRIWVKSEPGKGSSFFFTIQTKGKSSIPDVTNQRNSKHEKLPGFFSEIYPLHILIAEDNLFNQQVIVHILNKMGYQPKVVENGALAVAASQAENFDVIFMDMQMPEMDGLEATRAIRKALQIQPVIIALTANTMTGDREKCIDAGMNDYIGKPIDLEDVVLKLEKWALHKMTG